MPDSKDPDGSENRNLSDQERLWIGRQGLLVLLFIVFCAELWGGWVSFDDDDFDLVDYAADATTVLVNVTALWGLLYGLVFNGRLFMRLLWDWLVGIAFAAEQRVRTTIGSHSRVRAQLVFSKIWSLAVASSLGAVRDLIKWRDEREFRSTGASTNGAKSQNAFRTGRGRIWRLAALLVILSCLVTADGPREKVQISSSDAAVRESTSGGFDEAELRLLLPSYCERELEGVSCALPRNMNPETLGRLLSRWPGCGSAIWTENRWRLRGRSDRQIPANTRMTIPASCMEAPAEVAR